MPGISFYEGQKQQLKRDDITSSLYWSIRSEKMSFTYFEVPPNTTFEKHKHFSEQITYVLDGVLFFEAEGTTYCLRPGDCIIVPSNAEHRVWTNHVGAMAVDSWAPASEQY